MKNQYVLLTGSKSNAGDFLIKYRAKQLLAKLRPDRAIVDYDAWKPLTAEQIKVINESKALLLTGGPSVQKNMYPNIYALSNNLDDIKVPIITFGVGWKARSFKSTGNYSLSKHSLELLKKIDSSGFSSSVRDVLTSEMLTLKNFKKFFTTGCPALYDLQKLNEPLSTENTIKNITFSPGVSFVESSSMEKQTKDLLLLLKEIYPHAKIQAALHHPVVPQGQKNTWMNDHFNQKHLELMDWLTKNGFSYVDISGGEAKLLEHYTIADFHIGYRVHAHIFMISQNKPSVLISEDSRALSLKTVIGGTIIEGHVSSDNPIKKIFDKLMKKSVVSAHPEAIIEVKQILSEKNILEQETRNSIFKRNNFFLQMKKFIEMLP